jgi:hypothetical protein
MRIVAQTALSFVRIIFGAERLHLGLHLMAGETLLLGWDHCGARGVNRIRLSRCGREPMADGAMQLRLRSHHLAQLDLYTVVAPGLRAAVVIRLEAVDFPPVARDARELLHRRRSRVQMYLVSRGRRDAFPGAIGVALNVALVAHKVRHGCVHPDLLRPLGNPEIDLPQLRFQGLPVTGMTIEFGMHGR